LLKHHGCAKDVSFLDDPEEDEFETNLLSFKKVTDHDKKE